MTWSVLGEDGRVLATYRRQESAVLNAKERAVVEGPPEGGQAKDWRFGEGFTWNYDPLPDARAERLAAKDRDGRRKDGYARIDRDMMIEVAVDLALDLAEQPDVAARLRPTTIAKAAQLKAMLAAVKTQHP